MGGAGNCSGRARSKFRVAVPFDSLQLLVEDVFEGILVSGLGNVVEVLQLFVVERLGRLCREVPALGASQRLYNSLLLKLGLRLVVARLEGCHSGFRGGEVGHKVGLFIMEKSAVVDGRRDVQIDIQHAAQVCLDFVLGRELAIRRLGSRGLHMYELSLRRVGSRIVVNSELVLAANMAG
ncbi:hypothetical protein HYQ46_004346 [Verticillium longisporum]|nr:hypothetical protein HYQ46_004346 [Verticillium longisporum]